MTDPKLVMTEGKLVIAYKHNIMLSGYTGVIRDIILNSILTLNVT